jgi:hypothetical protein
MCINNTAIINNNYGRIQDLIMFFKIPMGTRRNFCKICGQIRANILRAEVQCCCLIHGLFPSGPPTNILYGPLLCAMRATRPAHPLLLGLMRWIKQGAGMGDRRDACKVFSRQTRIVKYVFSQPELCTALMSAQMHYK